MRVFGLLVVLFVLGCQSPEKGEDQNLRQEMAADMSFDAKLWKIKEGREYPYREMMLEAILYGDTIRNSGKIELLELLGEPDRTNENHLYYRIAEKRLGLITLHTKTMVIKLSQADSVEWIKVHE